MLRLNFDTPETVYAEYAEAASRINRQLGNPPHALDAKTLMNFALAAHSADDLVQKFYLSVRIARAEREIMPNPSLRDSDS
jgi:hypothetical protein